MADKPWIIYTRVSTEDQAHAGISLDAQLTACRAYGLSRGMTIAHEVADPGASASSLKRPGMALALNHLRSGAVAGMIVWRLDRATRSLRDLCALLEICEQHQVGLVSVMEAMDTASAMGRFVVHLLGAMAQWERETIGQRTSAAMKHARKAGFYTGSPTPAGTRVEEADGGNRRKLVRDHNADLVAAIWPGILAGGSLRDMARQLSTAGVISPTRAKRGQNNTWTVGAVRSLLLSPQVVGVLVDAVTQNRVRAALATRTTPRRRGQGSSNLEPSATASPLTGIFRCPCCGAAVCNVTATGRGGSYRYIRCTNRTKGTCRQTDLRTDRLETAIYTALGELCAVGGAYHQHLHAELVDARSRLSAVREESLRLRSERDQLTARVADLTLRQQIGTPAWNAAMGVVNGEFERVDRRLSELQGVLAAATIDEQDFDLLLADIASAVDELPKLPVERQRMTMRLLVERATLEGEELVVSLRYPGDQGALPPVAGGEVRRIAHCGDPNGARTRYLKIHNAWQAQTGRQKTR